MPEARFCSACGAALPAPPPVTCGTCGTSHWDNPKPCANVIVVEDGKVLLARRAYAPWKDAWGTPGGFCEVGEHPIETARREALEETGYRIEVTGYVGVWVDVYSDDPDEEGAATINVAYYNAVLAGGDPADFDPAEVSDVGWFAWDELPANLAPPHTLAAVLEATRSPTPLADRPTRKPPR